MSEAPSGDTTSSRRSRSNWPAWRGLGLKLRAATFALALSLCLVFLMALGFSGLRAMWPAWGSNLLGAALLETVIYGGCSVWLARASRAAPVWVHLPAAPGRLLACAALLGITLHGPLDYIEAWVEQIAPLSDALLAERAARLSPASWLDRVLLLVAVALVVPLAEEWYFRGALFDFLRRASGASQVATEPAAEPLITTGWAGLVRSDALFPVALTSVCFSVSHGEPRNWPALLLVALLMGALRAASGSIYPSILLHAAFNATTLIVSYSMPSSLTARPTPWLAGAAVGTALSCALLVLGLGRSPLSRRVR